MYLAMLATHKLMKKSLPVASIVSGRPLTKKNYFFENKTLRKKKG